MKLERMNAALKEAGFDALFEYHFVSIYEKKGGSDAELNKIVEHFISVFEAGSPCTMTHCELYGGVTAVRDCMDGLFPHKCTKFREFQARSGVRQKELERRREFMALLPGVQWEPIPPYAREDSVDQCLALVYTALASRDVSIEIRRMRTSNLDKFEISREMSWAAQYQLNSRLHDVAEKWRKKRTSEILKYVGKSVTPVEEIASCFQKTLSDIMDEEAEFGREISRYCAYCAKRMEGAK